MFQWVGRKQTLMLSLTGLLVLVAFAESLLLVQAVRESWPFALLVQIASFVLGFGLVFVMLWLFGGLGFLHRTFFVAALLIGITWLIGFPAEASMHDEFGNWAAPLAFGMMWGAFFAWKWHRQLTNRGRV